MIGRTAASAVGQRGPARPVGRIAALQGLREKLNSDGERLHRDTAQHAAFSQAVVDLTKIVSDGMTSVNKSGGV